MLSKVALVGLVGSSQAFQMPGPSAKPQGLKQQLTQLPAAAAALAVTFHAEAAHAKSVLGVNGALDFGPLAGDQPGGEGTGKVSPPYALCIGAWIVAHHLSPLRNESSHALPLIA